MFGIRSVRNKLLFTAVVIILYSVRRYSISGTYSSSGTVEIVAESQMDSLEDLNILVKKSFIFFI